jgi:hypothetical protein
MQYCSSIGALPPLEQPSSGAMRNMRCHVKVTFWLQMALMALWCLQEHFEPNTFEPTLHVNLCFGPRFTNKGGESSQGGSTCKLSLNGKLLLAGVQPGNMYKLQCKLPTAAAPNQAQCHSTPTLWHNRLGHPGRRQCTAYKHEAVSQVSRNFPQTDLPPNALPVYLQSRRGSPSVGPRPSHRSRSKSCTAISCSCPVLDSLVSKMF